MQAVRPKQAQKTQHKQSTNTRQITQQESLQVVKLLIHTGLGCSTYLRGIFPERVFNSERLDDLIKLPDSNGNRGRASTRVKILQRGQLAAADALLDTLDGINDAVERGYLKTLMMGIFLDPDHPYQLVELYAFNFMYRTLGTADGEKIRVPDVEIRDQLRGKRITSYNAGTSTGDKEEFTSVQRSKWTIGAVKDQAQILVKNLVTVTQLLETLPREKYITFKLNYTEETPEEYEPPKFRHADPEITQFTVGTKSSEAVPESSIYGKLDTGHHCMTVRMMSVAKQLPDQDELQASQSEGPPVKLEARQRPYLWSAEDLVFDEECEISFETLSEKESKDEKRQPLGVTASNGSLDPQSQIASALVPTAVNALHSGQAEARPQGLVTHIHSLPPDLPEDEEQDEGLTDADRLRLAAATCDPYTMETQSLSRIPTVRDPPSAHKKATHSSLGLRDTQHSDISDILRATQTLPRGTALARGESSIAFSSIFKNDNVDTDVLMQEDDIQGSLDAVTQLLDDVPLSSAPKASQPQPSPILDYSQIQATVDLSNNREQPANVSLSTIGQSAANLPLSEHSTPMQMAHVAADITTDTTNTNEILTSHPGDSRNTLSSKAAGNKSEKAVSICGGGEEEEGDLDCDCGNNNDSGSSKFEVPLVACDVCKSWKHLSCYGNLRSNLGKDEPFECYRCQVFPKDSDLLSDEEKAKRDAVLEKLVCLTIFRRLLVVFYGDGVYADARYAGKRLGVEISVAKDFINRAKEEGYLYVPTVLAEDSMQSSSGSTRKKPGRPKKPKASDFKANIAPAILKKKEERYFTSGEGEEKEIKQQLEASSSNTNVLVPASNSDSSEQPPESSRSRSLSLPEIDERPPKLPSSNLPNLTSPPRKVLENISNSPRANRIAPKVDLPPPPATILVARTSSARMDVDEQESYLPTPQTIERKTESPGAPPDASACSSSIAAPSRLAIANGESTYKPLMPRARADLSATLTKDVFMGSQEGPSRSLNANFKTIPAKAVQPPTLADSGRPISRSHSPTRKRPASAVGADEPRAGGSRLSPPKSKHRKASMADPIRARDERDDIEEEELDMAEIDESATEFSTDARK